MTESKPGGRVGVNAGEVLFEALPDGIEGFKTRRPFGGVNADTIGRAVIDGGEYSDRTIVEGHRGGGIDAPHLVRAIGGDGSGMRLARNGCGLALGRQKLSFPHQAQDPSLGGADAGDPEPRPEFPVSFPSKRRGRNFLPNPSGQLRVGKRVLGPRLRGSAGWFRRSRRA